jgi:hypothetical protein
MALKVKVAGSAYGVRPDSLRVSSVLKGRSTAKFSERGALGSLTRFSKGQTVQVYDDAISESVLVSNVYGSYGAPGLIWYLQHDGYAEVDDIGFPANELEDGTFELMFMINSGTEVVKGLLKTSGVATEIARMSSYGSGAADNLIFYLKYNDGDEGLYFRVTCATDSSSYTLTSAVGFPVIEDASPYRLSVTWSYDDGTTSTAFKLYVNGELRSSHTVFGRLVTNGALPDYMGWKAQHEVQPFVESYLADVRLWQVERSEGDIQGDMHDYLAGSESDLIGYWKFDEGSGTTLDDETVGAHDGTITAGTSGGAPGWGVATKDWTGTFDGTGTSEYQTLDWRHFTGRIEDVKLEKISPDAYQQTVDCVDLSGRFDELVVVADVSAMTCGQIIQHWVPRFCEDDEIGCRTVSAGPVMSRMRLNFTTIKKMLDELVKGASSYVWTVDPYQELRFEPYGLAAAPFDIDDDAAELKYISIHVNDTKGRYFNKIYARAKVQDADGAEFNAIITAQDDDEIAARASAEGSSGIHEHFEDLPTVRSYQHAVWLVTGMLAEAVSSGKEVVYETREDGLRPGMRQHITHDDYGLDQDFLITRVEFRLEGQHDRWYEVEATSCTKAQGFDSLLGDVIESKGNFRDPLIEWVLPAAAIGRRDGVRVSDTLEITSGLIP